MHHVTVTAVDRQSDWAKTPYVRLDCSHGIHVYVPAAHDLAKTPVGTKLAIGHKG